MEVVLAVGSRGALPFLTQMTLAAHSWHFPSTRQAFADVLATSEVFTADMEETYRLLDVSPSEVTTLDSYLQDYFTSILKKLKEVGASSRQTDFYV